MSPVAATILYICVLMFFFEENLCVDVFLKKICVLMLSFRKILFDK
jgi:hypothetical protein